MEHKKVNVELNQEEHNLIIDVDDSAPKESQEEIAKFLLGEDSENLKLDIPKDKK